MTSGGESASRTRSITGAETKSIDNQQNFTAQKRTLFFVMTIFLDVGPSIFPNISGRRYQPGARRMKGGPHGRRGSVYFTPPFCGACLDFYREQNSAESTHHSSTIRSIFCIHTLSTAAFGHVVTNAPGFRTHVKTSEGFKVRLCLVHHSAPIVAYPSFAVSKYCLLVHDQNKKRRKKCRCASLRRTTKPASAKKTFRKSQKQNKRDETRPHEHTRPHGARPTLVPLQLENRYASARRGRRSAQEQKRVGNPSSDECTYAMYK